MAPLLIEKRLRLIVIFILNYSIFRRDDADLEFLVVIFAVGEKASDDVAFARTFSRSEARAPQIG